ncbi:NAD-dependent epimerase/dehydratase family protein [Magnetospirillum sp. 15-1]|uniref:NAD-dependent epimerase/dehydratase family protein n=1 Tax=Magnetospirillum sp. 15-1 TaxID=1979370 RepID=UPI000BBCEF83|nr:NAD-dependent epimerase/dehydratase family protein [Magnetospirillum sp. 15-1]
MGNVLVIGGSYFAGRVFVEELTKHGDVNVYVFNRGRQPLGMPTVTELRGDRDRIEQVATAIPPLDWDTVVDFCGYEPAQVMSLLDHLPGNVRQYIFISTTTVYDRTTRLPVREDAPKLAAPQKELGSQSRYGFDKWLSEIAVQTECERRGIAFTIFRPAVIYGYYNYAPRESYFFDRLTSHRPIEIPEHNLSLFSVIWVVDMAQALIRALGEPRAFGKVYNLASDELISYGRIIDVLGEITGKTVETLALPTREIERRGLPLPFPLTEHLIYSGQAAAEDFGLAYTPFAAGIRESLKYYLMIRRAARARDGS